jgi:hypothetical protein
MTLNKKVTISILSNLFVITVHCYSQTLKKIDLIKQSIHYTNCNLNPFVIDDGKVGLQYKGKQDLRTFFMKTLDTAIYLHQRGEIFVQILVDKNGKACCTSVSVISGLKLNVLDSLEMDKIIPLTAWKPGRIKNRKWNTSTMLNISSVGK